jgi:N-acetylmuramoyl-L-alanine amidase
MDGVKNYFESTPPPGTWFAAQAARRNGGDLASTGRPQIRQHWRADDDSRTARWPAADKPRAMQGVRDMHRVGPGESLRSIARQYGISVRSLKSANQINADTVRAGTMLTIPTG